LRGKKHSILAGLKIHKGKSQTTLRVGGQFQTNGTDPAWYYLFQILAGELLLIFLSGFMSTFLLLPFTFWRTRHCPECGAPTFFAGQHFDPLGSPRPHWSDIIVFVVFVSCNVVVWIKILGGAATHQ